MPFPLRDRPDHLALLSLPLLVALVYAIAFPGHFFMDDVQIVQQSNFTYGWDLKGIFRSDYWGVGQNTGLYRPLTILSFTINTALLGHDAWGYYLVNLMLHATVCGLFFAYLRQLGMAPRVAWLASAIFAVHPIHAEPVIELVGRSELLAGSFALMALCCARSQSRLATPGVIVCFIGAILSKEHGVVLIGIIPLVDLFIDRVGIFEVGRRRLLLLSMLVTITILWLLYRKLVVHAGIEPPSSFDAYYIPLESTDSLTRVLSALKLQVIYLRNLFVPYHLQGMYPASMVKPFIDWFSWWSLAIFCVLCVLISLACYSWKRKQWWGLAIILYVVSFSPTANVLFPTGFTMADRIAYFPSIWFCMGLAAWLSFVGSKLDNYKLSSVLCVLIVVGYGLAGVDRAADFSTIEGLWKNDLSINPRNELSTLMLVDHYRVQGRRQEAIAMLRELIQNEPNFEKALSTYAGVLVEDGQFEEAMRIAKRAISLEKSLNCVSSARLPLASAYLESGRSLEALNALETISTADRLRPLYWELRGKAYEANGDYLTALVHYQKELSSSGERSPDGFRRAGKMLLQIGNLREAEVMLRRDVRINPQSAEGWNLLGVMLVRNGTMVEAQEAFRRAVSLKPESAEYRANLQKASAQ